MRTTSGPFSQVEALFTVLGQEVARMYQELGLAWLERQAQAAEELIIQRQTQGHQADL